MSFIQFPKDAPDLYLWWRDVWQEWRTRFVPVIMWRVTGMTHQNFTCDYVTCDRNDAPDFGGRIFVSRVNFLCRLLFRYSFHPRVTAVARKRPRSFCQKRRWQVTAKHAYTLRMWLCMKWHGAWLYGVHRTRRDGSSFLWHQLCQRCKYTTSVDIQKTRYKKLVTHVESHASAASLLESGE